MTSRVVYNSPSWFFSLTLFVVTRSEIISDNEEMLGDFSSEDSETVENSDEEDAGAYFVFNGDFAPYQGEPLASSGDDMEDNGADYACPYVAIFKPRLFIFDLNLFAFKFKLHVQNLFKFKTNSYLNFSNLFNTSLNFLFNLVFHLNLNF